MPETALFPVVAIGASAGGLEAFTQLIRTLPNDTGMAFVFIQHLDPTHHSILAELLAKAASMPVVEAKNGVALEPNRVYVIPPNVQMGILKGRLQLTPRQEDHGVHLPINFFMRSLAEERKSKAVGVILSGTGSDGTLGLTAIKAEGGITFAQASRSAKYDGMPRSAIASECVDFVLSAEEISRELVRIGLHPYLGRRSVPAVEREPENDGVYQRVFSLLQKAGGVDFRLYKPGTVRRRTLRRMAVHKIDNVRDYLKHLHAHPEEVEQLYQDLLIPVTGFFRDPEAFEALKSSVFPAILKDKSSKGTIRIWAPGCSTGEETYSLAMALLEFLGAQAPSFQIQLFGTDANERAIEKARSGIYPDQIAENVSPERLRQFFVRVEEGYRVSKAVRDLCVFARQNIAEDPPFSQMNLVSCRNLLIYFGSALQQKIMPVLHYALKPTGFLMLGSSESVSAHPNLFATVDKKHKIFSKKHTRIHYDFPTIPSLPAGRTGYAPKQQAERVPPRSAGSLQQEADRIVLERYAPSGVVINSAMEIVYFRGRTRAYIGLAPGRASLNLLKMARGGLAAELSSAINQAAQKGFARRNDVPIQLNGRGMSLNIFVERLEASSAAGDVHYLVLFDEVPPQKAIAAHTSKSAVRAGKDRKFLELQRRAASTEEHLQSVIESKEAIEEEFQSANEEILSANEELQSSNEELETSKEELQSTNEELSTVNDELRNRNLELGQVNNDLSNLLSSTTLPMIMVDRGLRIRRVTSASAKTMKILPSDIGRPISDIRSDVFIPNLEKLITEVIDTLVTKELEVQDKEDCWYLLRIRPYRTLDDKIEGAVLLLTDINLMKSASEHYKRAKEFAEGIIDAVRQPLVVLDSDLRVIYCNSAFFEDFKVSRQETDRQFFYRLGNEQWNIPKLRAVLEKLAADDIPVRDFEVEHDFPHLGHRTMLLSASRFQDVSDDEPLILLAVEDITRRKEGEAALRKLAAIVQSSDDAIISIDLERVITSWNSGAHRIFGYTEEEAVGQHITIIVPPDLRAQEEEQLRNRVEAGEHIEHYDTVRLTKQGVRVNVSLTISPVRDSVGRIVGASKIARDITERKQLEELRDRDRSQLESQVEQRTTALRSLSSHLMHVQDDEHRKIARELHDSVGQFLAAVKMKLAQADQPDRQQSKAALLESEQLLDKCLAEIRTISYLLHPPLLDESGLRSAASLYIEEFGRRSNIEVKLDISPRIERLPNAIEIALFRALQESLTNVHRHSESRKVEVHLELENGRINMMVRDYGQGIPLDKLNNLQTAPAKSLGLGLTGMRERVNELGGRLQILRENPGTTVLVTIPIGQDRAEAAG